MSDLSRRESAGGAASMFLGGGEMAERILALDWSASPLGPVETAIRALLRAGADS